MNDNTFLEHVAHDIINKCGTNLSRVAVVFPNKRAALFMNEYLARYAKKPIWSPAYITISELFRRHSRYEAGDSIKLICDLHKAFVECTRLDESLDHFYGWGQLLLADFDDLDKNMADAEKVFCNLKDIHALDDISYLDNEQRKMLKEFFANFTDTQESVLKKRFLNLWVHFNEIYNEYNSKLREQGILYEGALYRDVVVQKNIDFEYDKYVFVGFNLLQKVEQKLFARLKDMGKAMFYWDFDKYYMPNGTYSQASVAGHYIASYLSLFPNELDNNSVELYMNMDRDKRITFISSSTENAQARYASSWVRANDRYKDGKKTAIVMCDETILTPLMHSLPPEAEKVNITTGYPLSITPVSSLVSALFDLHTAGVCDSGRRYRAAQAAKVLMHPYTNIISGKASDVYNVIKSRHMQYPDHECLTLDGSDMGLSLIFPLMKHEVKKQEEKLTNLINGIAEAIKYLGINGHKHNDALFQESVFRMFTILNRMSSLAHNGDLTVSVTTLRSLIRQVVGATSIPFHGEPIVGMQVMGVLETRNLDFDHLLLLSCNEGNIPKGINDSSFIPYSIRKAHGLTTIDNKVAIYSYYFHRLLQRASDITIMYNNATENGNTGEMSRFMLQLMVDSKLPITHASLVPKNYAQTVVPGNIAKDAEVLHKLGSMKSISPSAINKYMRCQLAFFYQFIADIKEPDATDDTVDNRMFGNIFHKSAQIIYNDIMSHGDIVGCEQIDQYLANESLLAAVVDKAFDEELFKSDSGHTRHTLNGLQLINREVIMQYLRQLLRFDRKHAPFSIVALEKPAYTSISIDTGNGCTREINIGGIIDRIDMESADDGNGRRVRVVDYKTGHQPTSQIKSIEEIFDSANISKKHSDYFLQAILYSLIVSESGRYNPGHEKVSPALLFVKQTVSTDYNPILSIDGDNIDDVIEYKSLFMSKLKDVVSEIFDPGTAFVPTVDKKQCANCTYRELCCK